MNRFVECLICHKLKRSLSLHLRTHGITAREYKLLHPGALIVSEELSTALRVNGTENLVSFNQSELHRAQLSLSNYERWKDPTYREAISERTKAQHRSGSLDGRRSMAARWSAPGAREAQAEKFSVVVRKAWRDNYEEMLEINLNCNRGNPTEYLGTIYRSSLEARFARVLHENNVLFEYEYLAFDYVLDGKPRTYTPDFYVVDWDTFVEIKPECYHDNRVVLAKLAAVSEMKWRIILVGNSKLSSLETSCQPL